MCGDVRYRSVGHVFLFYHHRRLLLKPSVWLLGRLVSRPELRGRYVSLSAYEVAGADEIEKWALDRRRYGCKGSYLVKLEDMYSSFYINRRILCKLVWIQGTYDGDDGPLLGGVSTRYASQLATDPASRRVKSRVASKAREQKRHQFRSSIEERLCYSVSSVYFPFPSLVGMRTEK